MSQYNIVRSSFGRTSAGEEAFLYTLTNKKKMSIVVTNYGASIVSVFVSTRKGEHRDVVLGFDEVSKYEKTKLYLGATIGRYAGQIKDSEFILNGTAYSLYKNDHENCMHGGKTGFDKKLFAASIDNDSNTVSFTCVSPDGEEGFPGNLKIGVSYHLTEENEIVISYKAVSDKDTVLSITNDSYFNLDGHQNGTIEKHRLKINASSFLELGEDCCPNGKIRGVEGTPLDFRRRTRIGARINEEERQLKISEGYDHNWNIDGWNGRMRKAAELESSDGCVNLSVLTDLPGMQMYSGNYLDGSEEGKEGIWYKKRNGVCLEAQFYPAAPNFPHFPSPLLRRGEEYKHTIVYAFKMP